MAGDPQRAGEENPPSFLCRFLQLGLKPAPSATMATEPGRKRLSTRKPISGLGSSLPRSTGGGPEASGAEVGAEVERAAGFAALAALGSLRSVAGLGPAALFGFPRPARRLGGAEDGGGLFGSRDGRRLPAPLLLPQLQGRGQPQAAGELRGPRPRRERPGGEGRPGLVGGGGGQFRRPLANEGRGEGAPRSGIPSNPPRCPPPRPGLGGWVHKPLSPTWRPPSGSAQVGVGGMLGSKVSEGSSSRGV